MLLVTADAAGRYLVGQGIFGMYEITERYLMVIVVFLGASSVYRGGALIRVTLFLDRIPNRLKLPIEYFNHFFSLFLILLFVIATVKKAHRMFVSGATMDFRGLPLWPAYAIIPVGLLLLAVVMVLDIPKISKGESGFLKGQDQE